MNGYYTVSQYAKIMDKDPGNIRRMLIDGSLKGKKLGNQWIISENAKLPEDRRVKTGDYRNWRQRVKMNSRHPKLYKSLVDMSETIGKIYSNAIIEVLLYGSYARGQETEESDVDIALILLSEQTEEQYEKLTEVVIEYEMDLGITLSIIPIEQQKLLEWKTVIPFYKNLEKEGIVLWKSE